MAAPIYNPFDVGVQQRRRPSSPQSDPLTPGARQMVEQFTRGEAAAQRAAAAYDPIDEEVKTITERRGNIRLMREGVKNTRDRFLETDGADLFERDPLTGKLAKTPDGGFMPKLGAEVESLKARAQQKTGLIAGALSPTKQRGDPTYEATEAQRRLAEIEPVWRLKQQKYDRIQAEMKRLDEADIAHENRLADLARAREARYTVTPQDVANAVQSVNASRAATGAAPVTAKDVGPAAGEQRQKPAPAYNPGVFTPLADPATGQPAGRAIAPEAVQVRSRQEAATRKLDPFGAETVELARLRDEGVTHVGERPIAELLAERGGDEAVATVKTLETAKKLTARIADLDKFIENAGDKMWPKLEKERAVLGKMLEQKQGLIDKIPVGERIKSGLGTFVADLAEITSGTLDSIAIASKRLEESMPEWLVGLAGDDPTGKTVDQLQTAIWAKELRDFAANIAPQDPRLAEEFWTTKVPGALGSMTGFLLGGAAGRAAKISPTLTTLVLGSATGGSQGYRDAIAAGADEETARMSFLLNAGVGTTEVIPVSRMLGRLTQATKGKAMDVLLDAGVEGFEEFAQEFFQTTAGNAIAMSLYDQNRDLFEGAGTAGAAGGVTGVLTSLVVSALPGRQRGGANAAGPQATPPTPPADPNTSATQPQPEGGGTDGRQEVQGQGPQEPVTPGATPPAGITPPPAATPAPAAEEEREPTLDDQAPKSFEFTNAKGQSVVVDATRESQAIAKLPKDFGPIRNVKRVEHPVDKLEGEKINREWTEFSPESKSLGIPRAEMPQVKAEHRGALTQFLKARDIMSEDVEVRPSELKPTQAEFSPAKVQKAREFTGGDRAILVSSDNHVVDGHHQWMAKLSDKPDEFMRVIKLDAPIRDVLEQMKEFPSVEKAGGAISTPERAKTEGVTSGETIAPAAPALAPESTREPAGGAGSAPNPRSGVEAAPAPAPAISPEPTASVPRTPPPEPQATTPAAPATTSQPPTAASDKPRAKTKTPTPAPGPVAAKAPSIQRGQNKPKRFIETVAKAGGLKAKDKATRFLTDFAPRLHKANPTAFEGMEVNVLSQAEWSADARTSRQTPDSSAAYDPESNTLFINSDKVKGNDGVDLISAVVHESGHFAEKFALGEAMTQREWEKLTHEQRKSAKAAYDANTRMGAAEDPVALLKDRRARAEWVAMQFSRVVRGDTDSMPKSVAFKLKEWLELVRDLVRKWVGAKSLTTQELDSWILDKLDYAKRSDQRRVIGKTKDNNILVEDANGVRSYLENGFIFTEAVQLIPTRSGIETSVSRDRKGSHWESQDEIAARAPEPKPSAAAASTPGTKPGSGILPDVNPAAAAAKPAKSKVDELADKLFDGLLGTPAVSTQEAFPKDRRQMGIDLADAMIADGIVTPRAMADYLEKKFQGKARKFSDSLWSLFRFSDPSLPQAPDWNALYREIDNPAPASDTTPQDEPRAEQQPATDGDRNPVDRAGSAAPGVGVGQPDQDAGNGAGSDVLAGASADNVQTAGDSQPGRAPVSGEPPVGPGPRASEAGSADGPVSDVQRGDGSRDAGTPVDGAGDTGRGGVAAEPSAPSRANYHIADPEKLVGGGPKKRFNKNRKAIETYLDLTASNRQPTADELDAMAAYTGWGSFGQELFQGNWERSMAKDGWQDEDRWLRDHLGREEWESAQRSIINAHYTDPITVETMWGMVRRMGFDGGRVLEPSAGIGNFFGLMPADLAGKSQLTGIELDRLTGGMAKMLYPNANVQIKGYQDSKTSDNFYDLVIGNWPFANVTPTDRRYDKFSASLHDYFFLKAVDQVRPGGIVIGITSNSTMDKKGTVIRSALARKSELIAAYRLPAGAFEQYAGTKVVTDIVVLRKLPEPISLEQASGTGWINLVGYKTPAGETIEVNEYWEKNPTHVLGKLNWGHGTTTGRPGMIVERPNGYENKLRDLVNRVPEGVFKPWVSGVKPVTFIGNDTKERQNSIVEKGGKFYQVRGDQLALLDDVVKWTLKSAAATSKRAAELKRLVELRNSLNGLLYNQSVSSDDLSAQRVKLKADYDAFVAKHGPVTDSDMLKVMLKAGDVGARLLQNIERRDATGKLVPREILTSDIVRRSIKTENLTIEDAFAIDRYQHIAIDPKRIAELAKTTEAAVIAKLTPAGTIFKTPAGMWESRDQYLSGNVRQKLREAEDAAQQGLDMAANIEALKKVVPKDVPYLSIEPQLGGTWVNNTYYRQFIGHLLGLRENELEFVAVERGAMRYKVGFTRDYIINKPEARTQWGTDRISWTKIIDAAFNNGVVKIKGRDADGNEFVDEDATRKANEKVGAIREEFKAWIWKESERALDLQTTYNETFNSIVTPDYDGSFLRLDGLALNIGRGPFDFREHQKNAVWRFLVNGRGLGAHEVGTGKTFTMAGLALEARRLGMFRKPLIFAHNANSASVAADIQLAYPGAKVLYVNNLAPEVRNAAMQQIALDDWDAVVLPHSLIDRVMLREETMMAQAKELIRQLELEAIEAAAEEGKTITVEDMDSGDKKKLGRIGTTAKELVKQRERIIENIKKQAQKAKDDSVFFEDMGVDAVIVDEAHIFKKIPIASRQQLKGLNKAGSGRSILLTMITDYVKSKNGGKGVFMFTGTPITNTVNEAYNMMRYTMDDVMERDGVKNWDNWYNSFAEGAVDVELTASGTWEPVERLTQFVNVPELARLAAQSFDIVFAKNMPEFKPRPTKEGRDENGSGRPFKQKNDITIPMTAGQRAHLEDIRERARQWAAMSKKDRFKAMRAGDPRSPIIIEGEGVKSSLDFRLVDLNAPDEPNSKVNRMLETAMEHYREHPKSTQMIFMERGYYDQVTRTRKVGGEKVSFKVPAFNLAQDIVDKLVARGVPREQIAVFPWLSKEKRKLAAEAMQRGEIRFAIGGTETMGTGVNAQNELRAMHHLDAPWMPGELEQRNGRGWRQGNRWNTVAEYRYFSEGSHDGRRWQILLTKDKFIRRFMEAVFMKGESGLRIIDGDGADISEGSSEEGGESEESDFTGSFAAAVGDARILQRAKVQRKIEGLQRRQAMHIGAQRDAANRTKIVREDIARGQRLIGLLDQDIARFAARGETLDVEIGGKKFTDRKKIESALEAITVADLKPWERKKVGSYAGFDLYAKRGFDATKVAEWTAVGSTEVTFQGTFASLESNLRGLTRRKENTLSSIEDAKRSISNLQTLINAPFPRQALLDGMKKQLALIERELAMSPAAPPPWLRDGAPVGSLVTYQGKPYDVAAHRWDATNWYILGTDPTSDSGEMIPIPYNEAGDADGNTLFQPREFVQPNVGAAPAVPTAEAPTGGEVIEEAPPAPDRGPRRTPNGFALDQVVTVAGQEGQWRINRTIPDPQGSDNEALWSVELVRVDDETRVETAGARDLSAVQQPSARPTPAGQLALSDDRARAPRLARLRRMAEQMEAQAAKLRAEADDAVMNSDEEKTANWRATAIEDRLKKIEAELKKEEGAGLARAKANNDLLGTPPVRGTPAQEAILSKVNGTLEDKRTFAQRIRDYLADLKEYVQLELKQKMLDQFASIKRLERATFGASANLDASASAYKAARLTKNLPSVMDYLMNHGQLQYRAGSMSMMQGGRGLMQIFKPLIDAGTLRLWEGYVTAVRADRLLQEGKETNFGRTFDPVTGQWTWDAATARQEIDELIALRQQYPEFEQVRQDYVAFQKSILDVAEAAGLINQTQRATWEKSDYVPFYRITESLDDAKGPQKRRGIADQRSGIKKLKGGAAPVAIMENIVRNIESLVDASFKNIAMQRVADLAAGNNDMLVRIPYKAVPFKASVDEVLQKLEQAGIDTSGLSTAEAEEFVKFWRTRAPKGKDVVSVMVDGKAIYYRVKDAALLRSVQNMGPRAHSWWMNALMAPKQLLTGAVTLDPAFMAANTIRDSFSAWVIADTPIKPGIDSAIGFVKSLRNDPSKLAVMAAGGGSGHYNNLREGKVRDYIRRLTPAQRKTFLESIIDTPKKLGRLYADIGRATENANRIAIYDSAKKRGASDAEAAFQALDIMDFGLRGDSTALNFFLDTVPFLNARIQGLYRLGRGLQENPKRVATHGGIIIGASLVLLASNWDDERYWELPEWERDIYYHFWLGDQHVRIPKPFEVGQVFSTIPERMFEFLGKTGDGKLLGRRILTMIADTFAMNPIPQALKPAAERAMNLNTFTGRPIISRGDEFRPPEQQFNVLTSESLRELAEAMPDSAPAWMRSPKTLEHFVRGYMGSLGMYALTGADALTRAATGAPDDPSVLPGDWWVMKRFAPSSDLRETKYVSQFYEMHREVTGMVRQIKELQKTDPAAARQLQTQNADLVRFAPRAEASYDVMNSLRKQEQRVYEGTDTPEEKRRKLAALTARRNDIAQSTMLGSPRRTTPIFNPFAN